MLTGILGQGCMQDWVYIMSIVIRLLYAELSRYEPKKLLPIFYKGQAPGSSSGIKTIKRHSRVVWWQRIFVVVVITSMAHARGECWRDKWLRILLLDKLHADVNKITHHLHDMGIVSYDKQDAILIAKCAQVWCCQSLLWCVRISQQFFRFICLLPWSHWLDKSGEVSAALLCYVGLAIT